MQSVVKGKLIRLDGPTLKAAAGLSDTGREKPQPFNFGDFEEMITFRDCQRNPVNTNYDKFLAGARRKEDGPIPYALLLSKIFENAGVDLSGERKIILHASNKIEKSSLHHVGMLKQEDKWVFKGDVPPTPEPATDEDGVPSHDEDQPPQVEAEPGRELEVEPKPFSPFEQIMINKLDAVMEMSRRHESLFSGILDRFDDLDHEVRLLKTHLGIPEDED
uniref:Uncharacterized protein n=1 Tax=Cajanus cajan TaxID=3821 RepID=A0A151QNA7_CAJCA|nr:hypothetical protein KK1_047717 [Cajanus cajan]